MWLKKAMGRWSYIRIAPKPCPEASVSRIKGLVKSGRARTGTEDIAIFN